MEFSLEDLEHLKEGLKHYDAREYWECHEVLEHYWLELRGVPKKYIFWAVIQVAASLYHYRRKNLVGAQGLIVKAKEKILLAQEHQVENQLLIDNIPWVRFCQLSLNVPSEMQLEDLALLDQFLFLS